MIVGFTGSRQGLTVLQRRELGKVLSCLSGSMRNGAAEGADRDAAYFWDAYPKRAIDFYPCNEEQAYWAESWAAPRGNATAHLISRPIVRNRVHIVDPCSILVAAPAGPETQRGGTWSTIRYAKSLERPIAIVWPSGDVEFQRLPAELFLAIEEALRTREDWEDS